MVAATPAPPTSALIGGIERFNPNNADALQALVDEQCAGTTAYNVDANLAVLKLYQLDPAKVNVETVNRILLKALTHLPHSDFNLCMCLLNEQLSESAEIARIIQAHDLLQTAMFVEFWKHAATMAEQTSRVAGFADAVRQFIALTVSLTFHKISISVLSGYLNLQGDALTSFIRSLNWTIAGDVVTVKQNNENQGSQGTMQEPIKFEQLTRIIGYAKHV